MTASFPNGALSVLVDHQDHFLKRDKAVLTRIIECRDKGFIDALFSIDDKIRKYLPFNTYSGRPVYVDPYIGQWHMFLSILVSSSTDFNQDNAVLIKQAQNDFKAKISAISDAAQELAKQMRIIDIIGEKWGFSPDSDVHPLSLLNNTVKNQADSETAYRYMNYVGDEIRKARSFDLKYFPAIPDILEEIARQYSEDYIVFDSAKVPKQIGKINNFANHFFDDIEHCIEINELPRDILSIKNVHWCNIFSVSLGNNDITEQDIKNVKQRRKNKV